MTEELVSPEHFATFGQLLRHLRKRARLTLRELSISTGYSEGHLANLERNARRPDLAMVQALLLPALDLTPSWAERLLELASRVNQPIQEPPAATPMNNAHQPTANAPTTDLLATKLFAPQPRPNSVQRPRLLAQLNRALSVPLTLIAAPAGAGKTTLLATWRIHIQSSPEYSSSQTPAVAWLALDSADNDLAAFVHYLVVACRGFVPHAGAAVLALLPQAHQLAPATLLRPLLNDLAALNTPGMLILDDFHVLTSTAVHAIMAFFLEHLPPQLHLLIASREDPPLPLSRLRARGALVELRTHDLRFSAAESMAFLHTTMELPIAPEHVAILDSRTEGWAAGLQLAALALSDRPDQANVIAELCGTNRYLIDYLGDEVVDRLPAHLRTFVLQTSILERMCAELCDALLLGQSDTNAGIAAYSQPILRELERRHLFVIPLDGIRHWYRYHHLFADVMRSKLRAAATSGQIATLYQRAARWHEQQGMLSDAIHYALQAGPHEAVRIVEQHALPLLEQGAYGELRRWLDQLSAPVIWARPRLCLMKAITLFVSNPAGVETFLNRAAQLRQTANTGALIEASAGDANWLDDIPAVSLLIHAIMERSKRDYPRAIALLEQAIATIGPSSAFLHDRAQLQLGIVHLLRGDLSSAEAQFHTLFESTRQAALASILAVEAVVYLGDIWVIRGQLHEAAALYKQTVARNVHQSLSALSMIHLSMADLYYEWDDLAQAEWQLQRGFELGEHMSSPTWLAHGYTTKARVLLAYGDRSAAHTSAQKAQELLETIGPVTIAQRPTLLGNILLALGDINAAEAWAQHRGLLPLQELSAETEQEQLVLARLFLAHHDWKALNELTTSLFTLAESTGRINSCIELLIIQALASAEQSQPTQALAALTHALQLAVPGGYIRLFVDAGPPIALLLHQLATQGFMPTYLHKLLAAFPQQPSMVASSLARQPAIHQLLPLPEQLSARELEVLRLIADGHSNRAIASALTIEIGTVKRHIHSLLGKLETHSRSAAVARARALGLL